MHNGAILVQDRIEVLSRDLARLQQLFRERYRSAASQRGLHFVEEVVAPPLFLQNGKSTLYLRWQVSPLPKSLITCEALG